MAAARTERLLQAVEDATAEAPAAEALHALLHATRVRSKEAIGFN